jgi:hypothetical protein
MGVGAEPLLDLRFRARDYRSARLVGNGVRRAIAMNDEQQRQVHCPLKYEQTGHAERGQANSFEPTAIAKHSGQGSTMILMDGVDLYAVLDGRIELPDLLRRKYRHASQTGEIMLSASAILGG